MPSDQPFAKNPLADPALRQSLQDFVRRRVPPSDVDDVVQTVLVDALAAEGRPREAEELRKWLLGIARHKVADCHRRAHREPPAELPEVEATPAPIEARELVRWAEEQAGSTRDAKQTLDWMAREGEGEKLESIAASEQVPAARVRQRVSRMRRWMKERWLAELGAAAMLATLALVAWWLLRKPEAPEARPDKPLPSSTAPGPTPLEDARALRDKALDDCVHEAWQLCLDGLDKAKALDPDGDKDPAVGAARQKAEDALRTPPNDAPKDAPTPSAAPSSAPPPIDSKIDPKDEKKSVTPAIPKPKAPPTSIPTSKFAPDKPAPNFGKSKPSPKKAVKSGALDDLGKK